MEKSLVEYAYEVLGASKSPIKFAKLFKDSAKIAKLNPDESELPMIMSKFYTRLSTDGRFVILSDNKWDLRERHSFDDIYINIDEAYTEEEADEDIEEVESDKEEAKAQGLIEETPTEEGEESEESDEETKEHTSESETF